MALLTKALRFKSTPSVKMFARLALKANSILSSLPFCCLPPALLAPAAPLLEVELGLLLIGDSELVEEQQPIF